MILLRNERAEKLALIPTPVGVRPDDAARRERSGDGGKEKAPALIILNPAVVPSVVATRLLRIEKHERNEDDNDDQKLQETHTDEQVGEEVLLHGRVAGDADDERSKELANARRTTTHSHHEIAHPSTDVPELRTPRFDEITEFCTAAGVAATPRIAASVAKLLWRRLCAAQKGRSGDAILETPTRMAIA